jgi:hypothetical protein
MIGEQQFSGICLATGLFFAGIAFMLLASPELFSRGLKAFPRNRFFGVLLAAIGLLWSAIYIDRMTLGELGKYKWLLYFLTPLSLFLIIQYLDELLAARSLGGILMLYPTLMVDSAKWHPSSLRYIVLVLAYIMVVLGIWLVLSPFKFRIWSEWIMANRVRCFVSGAVAAALGIALFYTGFMTR